MTRFTVAEVIRNQEKYDLSSVEGQKKKKIFLLSWNEKTILWGWQGEALPSMTQHPQALKVKSAVIAKVKCELPEKVLQAGLRAQI